MLKMKNTFTALCFKNYFIVGVLLVFFMSPMVVNAQSTIVKQHGALHKTLGFPAFSKSTGWIGGSVAGLGAYVQFGFSVGGTLADVTLNGSGVLSNQGPLWNLAFQGSTGEAKMDFGYSVVAQYKLTAFGGTYIDDLPFVSSADFILKDDKQFNSYLLGGRSVSLEDEIQPHQIIDFPYSVKIAEVSIGASLGTSATNTIRGMALYSDKGTFTSEGQKIEQSNMHETYNVSSIHEKLSSTTTLHFTPNITVGASVGVTVWGVFVGVREDVDFPVYTYNYGLPSIDFTTSPDQSISFPLPMLSADVTSNPSNGGTIQGGGSYITGSNIALSAKASPGYVFTNWTENGNVVSTDSILRFGLQKNTKLVANFHRSHIPIVVSANPSRGGSASGGGTYGYGENVTITASPGPDYNFANWTVNGSVVSADSVFSFNAQDSTAFVANFSKKPLPVIQSFSPARAGEGALITLTGLNFTGTSNITFGGVAARSFTVSNDTIKAVLGAGSSGEIVVTNASGTGMTNGFTFVVPPSGLSYKTASIDATYKVVVPDDSATVTGIVDKYSINPDLPAGLSLDTLSGVISGTPTVILPQTNYTVTASNVAGKTTTTLAVTVNKKPLMVMGAVANNKVYDGEANDSISGAELSGVVPGDKVYLQDSTTGTFAKTGVGKGIPVSASLVLGGADAGNYTLSQPQGLSANITTAPLLVTANNQTKVFDSLAFSGFTVSYNGFVNGEDQSVLGGTLNFNGTATIATDAGSDYVIIPGGLTSHNYKITFVNGNLTIKKADQTIQFSALPEKQEGNNDFEVTATSSSGLPVTFSSSDNSIATVQGSMVTVVTAGTCYINADQSGDDNYNPAPEVPRELTITPYGYSKRYKYLFSPNGDGMNDYWRIPNIVEMGRVSVKIYDRWGSMVYKSSNYHNNWDGTYRGQQLPAGAYVCIIKSEKLGTMTGIINLVR